MTLKVKIDGIEVEEGEKVEDLILVGWTNKYNESMLAFKAGGWNIPIAKIKLYDKDSAKDAEYTSECADFIVKKLAELWNDYHQKLKVSNVQ